MAELIGQALGHVPGWVIMPAMLLIIIIAVEVQLLQTGESLIDIWKRKYGKK